MCFLALQVGIHTSCNVIVDTLIEKQNNIYQPRDWSQLIWSMESKCMVVEMCLADFFDYNDLYTKGLHLKAEDDNSLFIISKL